MADRFNIKFTIRAVDKFSKTMNKMERRLDSLQSKLSGLALKQEVEVDVDTTEAMLRISRVNDAMNDMDRIIKQEREIKVITDEAVRGIQGIEDMSRDLPNRRVVFDIHERRKITVDKDGDGDLEVAKTLGDLKDKNVKVKLSTKKAMAKLAAFKKALDSLDDKTVRLKSKKSKDKDKDGDSGGMVMGDEEWRKMRGQAEELNKKFNKNELARLQKLEDKRNKMARDEAKNIEKLERLQEMSDKQFFKMRGQAEEMNKKFNKNELARIEKENAAREKAEAKAQELAKKRFEAFDKDWFYAIRANVKFDADRAAKKIQSDFDRHRVRMDIIADFDRAVAEREFNKLKMPKIKLAIQGGAKDALRTMNKLATFSRNIGEVFSGTLVNSLIAFSSALVPMIASATGAIGSLGVMIGTAGGATIGLANALGIAAGGFGIFALTAKGAIAEILELGKIAKGTPEWYALDEQTRRNLDAIEQFKFLWGSMVAQFNAPIQTIFADLLHTITGLIERIEPIIGATVNAMGTLIDRFDEVAKSDDFIAFFTAMEESIGPAMVAIGSAGMDAVVGIMNMIRAFLPLSVDMQDGFAGMMARFREWSAGLGENEKFQKFIDYVRTNWPLVKSIFANGIKGIIALFAGFAPYAEEWMAKTSEMMQSFKDFANGLGENAKFQKFINYISENAPKVTKFIGDMVNFLVDLGVVLAPIGSTMLDVASKILEWGSSLMTTFPLASRIAAVLVTIGFAAAALAPIVLTLFYAFRTLSGIASIIAPGLGIAAKVGAFKTALSGIIPFLGKLALRIVAAIGGWPVVIGVALVMLGVYIFKHWDEIKAKTIQVWNSIGKFLKDYLNTVWERLKASVGRGVQNVKDIWNGLVETFKGAGRIFEDVVEAIKQPFRGLGEWISGIFDFDFEAQGRKIVDSITKGITGGNGKVFDAIGGTTGIIRNFLPFSPAKEGPLSDLDKLNFGGTIADSMYRQTGVVRNAMNALMTNARPNLDLAVEGNLNKPNAYNGGGANLHEVRAQQKENDALNRDKIVAASNQKVIDSMVTEMALMRDKIKDQTINIPLYLRGKEIARASNREVAQMQSLETSRKQAFAIKKGVQ